MRAKAIQLKLLAMPVLWMGTVQCSFGLLAFFLFHEPVISAFLLPGTLMLITALSLLSIFRHLDINHASLRDALIYASATWVVTGALGAIPIEIITDVSMADAFFESVSALTTTGATVLSGLDDMPKTFLLYRQFLQWMGGLGIVIFVVAVLPMLNVGGMKLLMAETPGPIKNDKLAPRISNSVRHLWLVYILLTVFCAIAYFLGGMSFYDAIAHSFTTVSTGGFSTHDASMGYFDSHLLLAISDVFMLAGAINFALHYRAVYTREYKQYWQDEECRTFLCIVFVLTLILTAFIASGVNSDLPGAFSLALFHIISFITSTGFGAADLSMWPAATGFLLIFTGYLGGCSGSTAGGNKIIRNIISFKIIVRAMRTLTYPYGTFTLMYQKRKVEDDVIQAVMAFMSLAALTTFIFTILLMMTGLSFWSSLSAVAACINVLGPGFGEVSSNFEPVSDVGISLLSLVMILGRLEYFTLLSLLLPSFWQR